MLVDDIKAAKVLDISLRTLSGLAGYPPNRMSLRRDQYLLKQPFRVSRSDSVSSG